MTKKDYSKMNVIGVDVIAMDDTMKTSWLLKEVGKRNIIYVVTIEIARYIEKVED